jgi:hypothetical protein
MGCAVFFCFRRREVVQIDLGWKAVGVIFSSLSHSIRTVLSFCAYFELLIRFQYSANLSAYKFVIVYNQNTFAHLAHPPRRIVAVFILGYVQRIAYSADRVGCSFIRCRGI